MLNHSTSVSESPHFHPPANATSPIMLHGVLPKFAPDGGSTPQRRVPPKRLCCKTCLGKACIGRCRF
jgi:hypothetical protein